MTTTTDTTEKALETRICNILTGIAQNHNNATISERPAAYAPDWTQGDPQQYNREHCIDLHQLHTFLKETQPEIAETLNLKQDNLTTRRFLKRIKDQITKRGTIDILRNGIKHGQHEISLFYGTPSLGNNRTQRLYSLNRFSVSRQLRYSNDNKQQSLDLAIFINGLPIATFELKNNLTKQTVADAIEQYKRYRNPREDLFKLGRCIAHFAVDEHEVRFCTQLNGKDSWFLPFNKGWNQGAGNPINHNGIKTDYLWQEILTRESLTDIIENYALLSQAENRKTQIWPRYHQLDVVRKLLQHAKQNGTGQKYLIQHSAGSGKSNSIAWLAHRLITAQKDDKIIFDSILIVTDRKVLDRQIDSTTRQAAQLASTVGHAENSGDLRRFITQGKKIIITTVQKFRFILDEIGSDHRNNTFAIIIDEAHSSQGGRTSSAMAQALAKSNNSQNQDNNEDDDDTFEDKINRIIEQKRLLKNASYFAFTATPKNKTLELFGKPATQPDGTTKHIPFHSYTMKQAIQEGFILDVLGNYTPVKSYYRLAKTVQDDPEFDTKKAKRKLVRFVEGHQQAIQTKAEIIVDHFQERVIAPRKINGQARAMVVTNGIQIAIEYYHAIRDYLQKSKSPYKAIVAFSGETEYAGKNVTEASLNGFPSSQIETKIQQDPYRFLICADKFQTGYDEPLLHTMYVDKMLSSVRAVQTLSRLNRAHKSKTDTFILDFQNDTETIREAFAEYYQTTILADETDPDKLHDLKSEMDYQQVYSQDQIDQLVDAYLDQADRGQFEHILDKCVETYRTQLDEQGQIDFKGNAKIFTRTYGFLAQILPFNNIDWEKLSIFLNFLIPKLPAPVEEDLSIGIENTIDMDSYRAEKQATIKIMLPDEDTEIDPIPTGSAGTKPDPEMERLSNIVRQFNDLFGDIPWESKERAVRTIIEDLPKSVNNDPAYRYAKLNSDELNAKIELKNVLDKAMIKLIADNSLLYRQYTENPDFKNWLSNQIFQLTYNT